MSAQCENVTAQKEEEDMHLNRFYPMSASFPRLLAENDERPTILTQVVRGKHERVRNSKPTSSVV